MYFVSPDGTTCVTRPWGKTECGCEFDKWGNATCTKGDVTSASYCDVVGNVRQKEGVSMKSTEARKDQEKQDQVWRFLKAIVFVCE